MVDGRVPIWRRYRELLRRRPAADVADELRFHVDMRVAEAQRAGLPEDEARAAALTRFGSYRDVESALLHIDAARARRGDRAAWLDDLRQDIRFAIRSLRRAPTFTLAATATLAIAIGANTAIFSVVNALLLRPLPYGAPEQLVAMWGYSTGELLLLRERLKAETAIGAYRPASVNIDDGRSAERIDGAIVSTNLFDVLRVAPAVGRAFTVGQERRGNDDVVILSTGLWRRRFGGDSTVIGRRILIDGQPTTLIGVMPEGFGFPSPRAEFWKPLTITRGDVVSLWAVGASHFIGRLRPGMTLESARGEIKRLAPQLRHANPMWDPGPQYGRDADLTPLQESVVGKTRPVLLLLLACVGLVLIVACVNVANLLLALHSARPKEL
jgi:putative ABC transport system permease protein